MAMETVDRIKCRGWHAWWWRIGDGVFTRLLIGGPATQLETVGLSLYNTRE